MLNLRQLQRALLLGILILAGCATTQVPKIDSAAVNKQTSDSLSLLRHWTWETVAQIMPLLERYPAEDFPGIHAFVEDMQATTLAIRDGNWIRYERIDLDKLIRKNPHFWQAYLETAPGDPAMLMLHGCLLAAGGDVHRALLVLTLGYQFGAMDMGQRQNLFRASLLCIRVIWPTYELRLVGLDRLKHGKAAEVRQMALAALKTWPQDAVSWDLLARADEVLVKQKDQNIAEELANAREQAIQHGPFEDQFMADNKTPLAEFTRVTDQTRELKAVGDETLLERFAATAQKAQDDEAALVAHAVFAGRRGRYSSRDEGFLKTSLARLISTDLSDKTSDRIFHQPLPFAILVPITEPPEVGTEDAPIHPKIAEQAQVSIAETSTWIEADVLPPDRLAENYRQRGVSEGELFQYDDAEKDLRKAIELNPQDNEAVLALADILTKTGRDADAEKCFKQALISKADKFWPSFSYGIFLFNRSRFTEADGILTAAAKADPKTPYPVILRHYERLRLKLPDKIEAADIRHAEKEEPWGTTLLRYLAGKIDQTAVYAAMATPGTFERSMQECEWFFALGQEAMIKGDPFEAERNFRSCVGTGISNFVEYGLALDELKRLAPKTKKQDSDKSKEKRSDEYREPV
ncbi:MAG TPA: tetratricopeptide repeat protein [Opitutaceae bacterium]|nr:tetratricopeptide repeat protein [Opitutaceae bacterium]